MCGIAGIASADPKKVVDCQRVERMCAMMLHRGPDDEGLYKGEGVCLGNRRLAILDLSAAGRMPISSEDGRYVLTYNGELYNFQELKRILLARGYRFRSNTDSEVVLKACVEYGERALDLMNGMFAFALWDTKTRTLLLARDRLGIKPLYYVATTLELLFASEVKALFAAGLPFEFDEEALDELVVFRYTAGTRTPTKNVQRLLPGHLLRWHGGQFVISRWWRLDEQIRARRETPRERPSDWFRKTFDDAVAMQRVADVPVGVLLSGGVDSASVAASLGVQGYTQLASFTVRFEETRFDEGVRAAAVARRFGWENYQLIVKGEDLLPLAEEASWYLDEPLAHGQDPHILAISRVARERVKVLLSGEGSDEILAGYIRYKPLFLLQGIGTVGARLVGLLPWHWVPELNSRGRLGKLLHFLRRVPVEEWPLYNACTVLPDDLPWRWRGETPGLEFRREVLAEARRLFPGQLGRQAMYLDQHTFLLSLLDRNDRMTMAASIECRVPFLDHRLVEGLGALPSRTIFAVVGKKKLLNAAIGERLPQSVRRAGKWGFAVPWSQYLRSVQPLRERILQLPRAMAALTDRIPQSWLEVQVARFLGGQDRLAPLLWQLFVLTLWHDRVRHEIGASRSALRGVRGREGRGQRPA